MFTLTIETEHAAFGDDPSFEVARILTQVTALIDVGQVEGTVRDQNGNTVGRFKLTSNAVQTGGREMRQILLSDDPTISEHEGDMQWLRDVHWPDLPAFYHSAILIGNEDYPDAIAAYFSTNPSTDDEPLMWPG